MRGNTIEKVFGAFDGALYNNNSLRLRGKTR